ncbi:MAG: PilW family protein [Burkholderiales bacterium]|jgi:type IV pilus assembly protein PilW|nr:PilW family protein [Burkholderiales bacterium]
MMSSFFRQKGITLVELMVAALIGLFSMYAVYRVYEGTERMKRNVISVGDAQVAGLYSLFVLEHDIKSAGAGMMIPLDANGDAGNGALLAHCANDGNVWGTKAGTMGTPKKKTTAILSLRPIPVLIVPNRTNFDDIFIFSGHSSFHVDPLAVTASDGSMTTITTPFGLKEEDVLIDTMTQAGAPPTALADCQAYLVSKAPKSKGFYPADAISDTVTVPLEGKADAPAFHHRLVDLGVPVRRHFYVDDKNTLQMEEWRLNSTTSNPDGGGGVWVLARTDPLVEGVVSLRAMYGIGAVTAHKGVSGNNVIGPANQWVLAEAPWNAEAILNAPLDTIRQIKAVWLSVIIKADEPEFDRDVAAALPTTFKQFSACPQGTACPSSVEASLSAGSRYRMVETVVPLVNTIQN